MKKIFTLPTVYVLLWSLYWTQGTIIAKGSIYSRVILVLFLLVSIYYWFSVIMKQKQTPYFKYLNVLLGLFTVYGVVNWMLHGDFNYLRAIYLSLLPTFVFYVLVLKGKIDEEWIKIIFFVMAATVVIEYRAYQMVMEKTLMDTEMAVVNVAYEILALIPLVTFFKKKPVVQYVMMAIIIAFIITTVKRGAIIISAVCLLYFINTSLKNSSKKTKWYVLIIAIIFVVLGTRYVVDFFENSTYAQYRVENTLEGDSSGRDIIFNNAWKIFIDSDFIGMLFGHGGNAVKRIIGIEAHNDWLELLVDLGLVGAVVYLLYWITFFRTYKKEKNIEIKQLFGMLLIIFFLSTLFSMSYVAMTLPANLALGYGLAKQHKEEIEKKTY